MSCLQEPHSPITAGPEPTSKACVVSLVLPEPTASCTETLVRRSTARNSCQGRWMSRGLAVRVRAQSALQRCRLPYGMTHVCNNSYKFHLAASSMMCCCTSSHPSCWSRGCAGNSWKPCMPSRFAALRNPGAHDFTLQL